jgi:hypothetical protein
VSDGGRPIDATHFPNGIPASEPDLARTVELYKLMVASSESLVARRQGVNTFFLTITARSSRLPA